MVIPTLHPWQNHAPVSWLQSGRQVGGVGGMTDSRELPADMRKEMAEQAPPPQGFSQRLDQMLSHGQFHHLLLASLKQAAIPPLPRSNSNNSGKLADYQSASSKNQTGQLIDTRA